MSDIAAFKNLSEISTRHDSELQLGPHEEFCRGFHRDVSSPRHLCFFVLRLLYNSFLPDKKKTSSSIPKLFTSQAVTCVSVSGFCSHQANSFLTETLAGSRSVQLLILKKRLNNSFRLNDKTTQSHRSENKYDFSDFLQCAGGWWYASRFPFSLVERRFRARRSQSR